MSDLRDPQSDSKLPTYNFKLTVTSADGLMNDTDDVVLVVVLSITQQE